MKTSDFDYYLPKNLIAQSPAYPRDACKLLVLHRDSGKIEHKIFREIHEFLSPKDLLVVNETRVLPARLQGKKYKTGGEAECLLLTPRLDIDNSGCVWECLVKPGRRLKPGAKINFWEAGSNNKKRPLLEATILDFTDKRGERLVEFKVLEDISFADAIHKVGVLPLPPYITEYHGDMDLYQTVYAKKEERSAAAPTAGLHFTNGLIEDLEKRGVQFASVELEVGIDTFRPVEVDNVEEHIMHSERYHVSQDVVDKINKTKAGGGRVVAVGTTSVRSLESAFNTQTQKLEVKKSATTDLFLYPGKEFHVVDALITNFHVPKSTLMMLVSAFATKSLIMKAYKEAVDHQYRFLSFGDAMLIL